MNKAVVGSLVLTLGCIAGSVSAQPPLLTDIPEQPAGEVRVEVSPGAITPTPEMWFYEQQRRVRADRREFIRAKAEFQAVQRQRRLANLRWYGLSNSRPGITSSPYMGNAWANTWVGGAYDPFAWPVGVPTYSVR